MINLNMIAERRSRKTREIAILRSTAIGVILLFIAAVGINIATYYWYGAVNAENVHWQDTRKGLDGAERDYQSLSAEVQGLRPVVGLLERVRLTEAAWMTILADLGRVMPRNASIGGVTASNGASGVTLSMNGSATEPRVVGDLMVALREGTRWAADTKLGNLSSQDKDGSHAVGFSLTVTVRGMFGGEL